MGSLEHHEDTLIIKELFNEEQSAGLFSNVMKSNKPFTNVIFENVGIKIMREVISIYKKKALKIFEEREIQHVEIRYDWNYIMMRPDLVCYDKNKWKTLQQLANWNKEWNELFIESLALRSVSASISISWMDDQFIKHFLEGVNRLPNIQQVLVQAKSKDEAVAKMLNAFKQAVIFPQFDFQFEKL